MTQTKTYPLVSSAALALKILHAGGPKLDPTQKVGQASADGITLGWTMGGTDEARNITIGILQKPWIIPASTIWEHVDALFPS